MNYRDFLNGLLADTPDYNVVWQSMKELLPEEEAFFREQEEQAEKDVQRLVDDNFYLVSRDGSTRVYLADILDTDPSLYALVLLALGTRCVGQWKEREETGAAGTGSGDSKTGVPAVSSIGSLDGQTQTQSAAIRGNRRIISAEVIGAGQMPGVVQMSLAAGFALRGKEARQALRAEIHFEFHEDFTALSRCGLVRWFDDVMPAYHIVKTHYIVDFHPLFDRTGFFDHAGAFYDRAAAHGQQAVLDRMQQAAVRELPLYDRWISNVTGRRYAPADVRRFDMGRKAELICALGWEETADYDEIPERGTSKYIFRGPHFAAALFDLLELLESAEDPEAVVLQLKIGGAATIVEQEKPDDADAVQEKRKHPGLSASDGENGKSLQWEHRQCTDPDLPAAIPATLTDKLLTKEQLRDFLMVLYPWISAVEYNISE